MPDWGVLPNTVRHEFRLVQISKFLCVYTCPVPGARLSLGS